MEKVAIDYSVELLKYDSPSGYCKHVIEYVESVVLGFGYKTSRTHKGNLNVYMDGLSDKTIGVCGHVDTLGAMVRSIKSDGTLAFTLIGGPLCPTLDGEYCRIITRSGKVYTGTFLSNSPAAHVHVEAGSLKREPSTMHIRLDEVVLSREDVLKLGIDHGDIIAIDTKTVISEQGFIKSRFLDDKLSVGCMLAVLKEFKDKGLKPAHNVVFIISTYEEVGHGSSFIDASISELLAVDMGCIGEDLGCSEYDVSICAKDSSGPYDYDMVSKLVHLSKVNKLSYVVDIYPFYGSDVSSALRGGNNIRGALIGPGVHASHGMERSHTKAVYNTTQLIKAYLLSE